MFDNILISSHWVASILYLQSSAIISGTSNVLSLSGQNLVSPFVSFLVFRMGKHQLRLPKSWHFKMNGPTEIFQNYLENFLFSFFLLLTLKVRRLFSSSYKFTILEIWCFAPTAVIQMHFAHSYLSLHLRYIHICCVFLVVMETH